MSPAIELYEDAEGDWRWRLRHENGNIMADSGQGYASRSGAMEAIESVKDHVMDAEPLVITSATFEIYEDAAEEWRWRLRHRNGRIVADSGEGYASRAEATAAVRRVKEHAIGAPEEEL